jgi:hypothetical protein
MYVTKYLRHLRIFGTVCVCNVTIFFVIVISISKAEADLWQIPVYKNLWITVNQTLELFIVLMYVFIYCTTVYEDVYFIIHELREGKQKN